MSNHDGGYMLNGFMHGLMHSGILEGISAKQKKSICRLLRGAIFEYDCNWPEMVDAELAVILAACTLCGRESKRIDAKSGCCVKCNQG